ncbi:MAG: hypothetical protein BWK78_09565 [Thiotrichaceae bacterium IS1]|nr:MAG: hypothetical protein BWK78_09565 [Thiotrichaceae bacterium IS1]
MDHKYEKLLQDLVDISLLQKLKDILAHSSDEESILKLIKQEGIIPLDILENIPTGEFLP